MTIDAICGSVNITTSAPGTTIDLTGSITTSGVTAVFLWWNGRTDSTDAVGRANHHRGYGFATSTSNRRAAGSVSADAQDITLGGQRVADTCCVIETDGTGAEIGAADFDSVLSNGVRLIIDNAFSVNLRVGFVIWTGLTSAEAFTLASKTTTGNYSLTGLSFQPDVLIATQSFISGALPQGSNTANSLSIGFATASGANQAVLANGIDDQIGTSETDSYCINDVEVLAAIDSAGSLVTQRSAFVSFNSDGFTLDQLETNGTALQIIGLVMKGGSWKVTSVSTQTDTSTSIVTPSLGFNPVGALLISAYKAESTQDTPTGNDTSSVGAVTGTSERVALAVMEEDGLGVTEVTTAIEHDTVYAAISTASAIEGLMDIVSIDSDTLTFIMDDADPSAKFVPLLAFGNPAAGGGQPTMRRWGAIPGMQLGSRKGI